MITSNDFQATPAFGTVYEALKGMAHHQLRRSGEQTLNTTALVHELYLRLSRSDIETLGLSSVQLYAYAAKAMRHILVDNARLRFRLKNGNGQQRLSLTDHQLDEVSLDPLLALQLDAALTALEADNPRAARVVELHYFGGLDLSRVAGVLGVVRRTVDRDWRYARAYLLAQLV